MAKYKLRLNLNTGGTVTTNAIDLPAKVVSAEFVEERSPIIIIGTGSNTTLGTSSIQVDVTNANTWNDLIGTAVGNYSIVEGFGNNGISISKEYDGNNWDYVSTTQSFSNIVQPATAIVPGTTYYLIYHGGGAD